MRYRIDLGGKAALLLVAMLFGSSTTLDAQAFPYTRPNWEWGAVPLLAAGAYFADGTTDNVLGLTRVEIQALDPSAVNWFDRYATRQFSKAWQTTSDVLLFASIAGAFATIGPSGGEDYWTGLVMLFEVEAVTRIVTSVAKATVRRTRPYAHNVQLTVDQRLAKAEDEGDVNLSFFSGHSSAAFAAAVYASTYFQNVYPDSRWNTHMWIGTLAAATGTAFGRMKAGKHYLSDVMVGAAVGVGIALAIPRLHRRDDDEGGAGSQSRFGQVSVGFRIGVGPGR